MSDLLKKVIQGLINEDESSASEALHQYITNKTRQIAGLNEGDADDMFEADDSVNEPSQSQMAHLEKPGKITQHSSEAADKIKDKNERAKRVVNTLVVRIPRLKMTTGKKAFFYRAVVSDNAVFVTREEAKKLGASQKDIAAVGTGYLYIPTYFDADDAGLNEENENDVGAQVKSIIKKLMPDDGMQLSNVQVDEDGIEFNVTADFKEHHPSMIGFQKNIKPLFSRIGFEKDDFEGRYYQLTAAKSFSDTEIADIEKALSALSESTIK
jgi:hypothetical protein